MSSRKRIFLFGFGLLLLGLFLYACSLRTLRQKDLGPGAFSIYEECDEVPAKISWANTIMGGAGVSLLYLGIAVCSLGATIGEHRQSSWGGAYYAKLYLICGAVLIPCGLVLYLLQCYHVRYWVLFFGVAFFYLGLGLVLLRPALLSHINSIGAVQIWAYSLALPILALLMSHQSSNPFIFLGFLLFMYVGRVLLLLRNTLVVVLACAILGCWFPILTSPPFLKSVGMSLYQHIGSNNYLILAGCSVGYWCMAFWRVVRWFALKDGRQAPPRVTGNSVPRQK